MKKPVVDYRKFRPNKLFTPEFRHLNWLFGWVWYLIMYLLTENLIPVEKCHPVHSVIDDIIPFCEVFVIPYVFWYLLIVISLGYFALYDIKSFCDLSKFILITQVVAMIIYIVFPTRQDLRPAMETLPDNFCADIVRMLYTADTNTGVCPSLHVAYSVGIVSVWLKYKPAHWLWKTFVVIAAVLICLSTMFIKQHSAVDFFVALIVCLLAEIIVYYKRFKNILTKNSKV
ncbi:MAG: phosphatidic acid phosphatase [Acutalibacteraceae bacterium]|nr:phosphatidic acid phosphatase [Acutalibacteraceae bacterium]